MTVLEVTMLALAVFGSWEDCFDFVLAEMADAPFEEEF